MISKIAKLLALVILVGAIAFAVGPGRQLWALFNPPQQDLPLPETLIALDSPEGQRMLETSASADYVPLLNSFQPQQYGSYCGVASSVIALNALGRSITQDDFFTDAAEEVRQEREVLFGGMSMDALAGLLGAHDVGVQAHHAEDSSIERFRRSASLNLKKVDDLVLVNYHRATLGQEGGGHISPVAAYEPKSDRFLILDTAEYKYPPVWVTTEDLWAAMDTVDSDGGRTRGYVLIDKMMETEW